MKLSTSQSDKSLFSPLIDFLGVGGASLIFLFLALASSGFGFSGDFALVGTWAYVASFFCNFPHFVHSYQIFYQDFLENLLSSRNSVEVRIRMVISGILVPSCLIFYILACLFIIPSSISR